MKKLLFLGLAISPLMLSAELMEETITAVDFEKDPSFVEESEVSYLSDNHGGYFKRSARSADKDDNEAFEQEYEPKSKSARSVVAKDDSESECKPKPKPECKTKPACPPKCKPEPMYKTVTKQVRCCPPAKQIPEPCCCLMYPSAHETMIQDGSNVDIFLDWLYYQVSESGLGYTCLYTSVAPFITVESFPDSVQPGFDSGFRLGLDYTINHDDWQLLAEWSRFNQNYSFSNTPPPTGPYNNLKPLFYTAGTGQSGCNNTEATWHFNYNVLDFTLGRDFYCGKRLFLKPYIGFRAAWINQNFIAYYNNLRVVGALGETACSASDKQNFSGYGMDFGADGRWMFSKHFGLYSNVSGSILWGLYENKILNNINTQVDPTKIEKYTIKAVQPVVDIGVGFEWETYFSCDTYYLSVHAGWEQSLWIGHNRMFASAQAGDVFTGSILVTNNVGTFINDGSLSLSGISVGAKFGF